MMWRTRRAISGASWVFPWPWGLQRRLCGRSGGAVLLSPAAQRRGPDRLLPSGGQDRLRYKGDTSSIVTKSAAQSEEFYTSKGRSGGRDRYEFPVGASLTCGDFDGDGDVDLFLAGMLGQLGTWKKQPAGERNHRHEGRISLYWEIEQFGKRFC